MDQGGRLTVGQKINGLGHDGQVFFAVIPAGGSGTRLWPLSRADNPKFLLPLAGQRTSLLQRTVHRLEPLSKPESTLVVTGGRHAAAVARQLPQLPSANIVVEPSPKDSCAAISLAAAIIARREPDAIMGSFAADHAIRDEDAFVSTVQQAIHGAEQGLLMTVGMRPTRPETGFGYVHCAERLGTGPVRRVLRFKEKPHYELAAEFVRSGDYLWNASVFVWKVGVFLDALARFAPDLHAGITEIAAAWETPQQDETLSRVWPRLRRIAIEYAVMEPAADAGRVATVPGDFGWSDIGDFRNLRDILPSDGAGNVLAKSGEEEDDDRTTVRDSADCILVPRSKRHVALVGLHDIIVVDTDDVLLVCDINHAQDVREVVAGLPGRNLDQYI